eukprot:TRINITY_DN495_c0_g1_i1.p1 TRINITY_DN495_c0_g1~~TRINITY_DN495_c0_g1_i1.p1  ORF type:complete len:301 (-),score=80.84 TRINITY_DN495_c0_g1_i1:138-1040(-)
MIRVTNSVLKSLGVASRYAKSSSRMPFASSSKGASQMGSSKGFPQTSKGASKEVTTKNGLEQLKQQLVSLSAKEIQSIKEAQDTQFAGIPNDAQMWLNKSGYSLSETEEGISVLSKAAKDYSVRVHFSTGEDEGDQMANPDKPAGEDEQDEDEQALDQSETDAEVNDAEGNDVGQQSRTLSFEAEIIFNDKQGEPKGGFILTGEVGEDCRVYVNDLQASTDIKKHMINSRQSEEESKKQPKVLPVATFDKLNQDFQDRVYDLLDEVGIDDKMGSFIRYHADTFEDKQSVEVMENIRKILS